MCVRMHVWLCVHVGVHGCVCVRMCGGWGGGLGCCPVLAGSLVAWAWVGLAWTVGCWLAGLAWKFGMGMGFRQEDATIAVVANLGFETSFYG